MSKNSVLWTVVALLVVASLVLAGCGVKTPVPTAVATQPPAPTPIPLPVTTEPTCGTVVTMIEEGPPAKFGETKIEIEFVDFYYDGIVAGGGFVEPRNGGIEEVHIGGKKVTLTRNDFSEGYIHTEEFGKIKVLFTANVLQECVLLIATPEQVTQISDWLGGSLGGSQGTKSGSTVTLIYTQEFDSIAPLYTSMWFSWTTWQMYLHWPWEFDEKNEPFPVLVTEIPSMENGGVSADGRVITMHLRDDIKWSDDTPVTADDFIFTWEMAVSPNNAVASTYPYDLIESIEAPDPQTVVITFTEPFAPWLATLWHGILPAHILRPVYDAEGTIDNADWLTNPTVGCGPYTFAEWESGSYARFVRNENYWGTPPKIDEIFIRFVPDDASQTAALKAGDADLGTFIAYSDVPALQDAGLKIMVEPSGYSEWMFFLVNAEKGHPALLDVNVRKAIALAIDREAINRDLFFGLTSVPASFWDALPFYNDPPLQNYPYDPVEAKRLLDEAGWVDTNGDGIREKNGVDLELTHATTIREVRQDVQAVMQQQLAEVGIKLDILSVDDTLYFASYADGGPAAQGEYDIQEWSDGPLFPDPDLYYWLCSQIPSDENPSGENWFYLCDEELDRLIQLQSTQVDITARQKTISQINQLFYDKVYIIGLWQDPDVYAVGPRLKNVKFSGVTMFFNIGEWDLAK